MSWVISGGTRLDGDTAPLAIHEGVIAERPDASARRFDAAGLILAPGICDVHGDGFERNLSPRPGVQFDIDTALIETDRQLITNGITTAYLALTISWEPGLRGIAMARAVIAALARLRPQLSADIRVQLRWEVFALEAVDEIEAWLRLEPRPVIAFNDHLTGMLRGERMVLKLDEYAGRAGVACFAHDEADAEMRRQNRALGITVSEFPLTKSAAAEAISAGEPTVLGAPNILRGGSHIGAIDAAPAVVDGLCSALASDYFYPAQLRAMSRLGAERDIGLSDAWPLIAENPARMAGLTDRGSLAPGQRADVIALSRTGESLGVEAVFVAGRPVYLREASRVAS